MHLRGHGIEVAKPTVSHYGMRQLSIRDPDGFGLCFQSPEGTGGRQAATGTQGGPGV